MGCTLLLVILLLPALSPARGSHTMAFLSDIISHIPTAYKEQNMTPWNKMTVVTSITLQCLMSQIDK